MATYTANYNLKKPDATDPFGDFRQDYNNNLDTIDANLGGGGGDVADVEVNGVSVVDGNHVAKIVSYKEVTQAQYDALPASKLTDGIAYFIKDGGSGSGGGSFLLIINAQTGETVTATKGGTTITATEVSTGIYEVELLTAGTWTISDGNNTATVDVGVYTATLSSIPEGATVTPTDDVSIWIACGGRTENYTTVAEVLADSTCLLALLSDNNANDYLVRSTTWANTITADSNAMTDIGLNNYAANLLLADNTWRTAVCNSAYFESVLNVKVPTMTGYTTPSGEASASSENLGTQSAWKAFNNNTADAWLPVSGATNNYISYEFASSADIYKIDLQYKIQGTTPARTYKIQYGNSYTDADTLSIPSDSGTATLRNITKVLNNKISSNKFRLFCSDTLYASGSWYINTAELQFYGRKDI